MKPATASAPLNFARMIQSEHSMAQRNLKVPPSKFTRGNGRTHVQGQSTRSREEPVLLDRCNSSTGGPHDHKEQDKQELASHSDPTARTQSLQSHHSPSKAEVHCAGLISQSHVNETVM